MTSEHSFEPWEAVLISRQGPGTIVQVAREGRLRRNVGTAVHRVDLSWIDEAALALLDAAVRKRREITFLYPAPAGEVAILLAAQVLLMKLQVRELAPSVGLLTADPAAASETWNELRIQGDGSSVAIADYLPCYRAGPHGESPWGRSRRTGLIVGRRSRDWPVDMVVVDCLGGTPPDLPAGPKVMILADPFDPMLPEATQGSGLLWGWSENLLALWHDDMEVSASMTVPFSIANDRLKTIADGIEVTFEHCRHEDAEACIGRARRSLAKLTASAGNSPPRHLVTGLRIGWSHVTALSSLPCRPSEYDAFAGMPPRAARATSTFSLELAAWAKSLQGEQREYASDLSVAVADLREALEVGNPMAEMLMEAACEPVQRLLVLRTKTAVRAFHASLGGVGEPASIGSLTLSWLGRLHRTDVWANALVVGVPPRSAWHLLASGMAKDITILTIGETEAKRGRRAYLLTRKTRADWSSTQRRARVWTALFREEPPPPPIDIPFEDEVTFVEGPELVEEADPFSPLGELLSDDRPLFADEGPADMVAEPLSSGDWRAEVMCIEVITDAGRILLPEDREVDVFGESSEPAIVVARDLTPGTRLLVGRASGRVGLLEALESRLKNKPDLMVSRLLLEDYQSRVYAEFDARDLSLRELHQRLARAGCHKVDVTVRSWVTPGGAMAPRDFDDLRCLNEVLGIGFTPSRIKEIFAAVTWIRTFRRAAGKALAKAASVAATSKDYGRVDEATGLSVADLREAVVVAKIRQVHRLAEPVPITLTGYLHMEAID